MKYLFFDTETSGLFEGENTMLSLSYQVIESNGWYKLKERNYYFAWPEDEHRVSPEAIAINGLTKKFLSEQKLFNQKEALNEFISDVKLADLVIAHNFRFDQRFVQSACVEYQIDFDKNQWPDTYDTMQEMTLYCRLKNDFGSDYKWPKLKELAQILQVDYSDIVFHHSDADVELTQRCFKEIIRLGLYVPEERQSLAISVGMKVHSASDIQILYFFGGRLINEDYISPKQRKLLKQQVYDRWVTENQQETDDIVCGYKKAPYVKSESDFEYRADFGVCPTYKRELYMLKPLSKEEVEHQLMIEAEQKFNSIFFWKNKTNRKEYVALNLESRFEEVMREYNISLAAFEKEQDEKERAFNVCAQKEYQHKQEQYQKRMNGDHNLIKEELTQLPKQINRPLELAVNPILNADSSVVDLNMQLPNIDDMPRFTAVRTSSGTYKIKELKNKEVQANYAECVIGLGFFFAACGFNISPCIKQINIRSYIQGYDSIGKQTENTIYTLTLTRNQIREIDFKYFSPVEALQYFPHTYNMPKDLFPSQLKTPMIEDEERAALDLNSESCGTDPLFIEVAKYAVLNQIASVSRFQSEFAIGYNRGNRLINQLEAAGIVGPNKGPKGRDVLIQDMELLENLLQSLGA